MYAADTVECAQLLRYSKNPNAQDQRSYAEVAVKSNQTTSSIERKTANQLETLLEQMITQNKQIIDLIVKLATKLL